MKKNKARLSVIDPIGKAIDRTNLVCFQNWCFGKWITIAFTAWLALMAASSGGSIRNFSYGPRSSAGEIDIWAVFDYIDQHLAIILAISAGVILAITAFIVLLLWLGCRGQMMFISNVAKNKSEVAEPWKSFAKQANGLFLFRVLAYVLLFAITAFLVGTGAAINWSSWQMHQINDGTIIAVIVWVCVLSTLGLFYWHMVLIVEDFLVPIMYSRKVGVYEAWRLFFADISFSHFWKFVLFYLMRVCIDIAITLIILLAFLATCCLLSCVTAVPFLGTFVICALFLPLIVFKRCYSMYFVEQLGDEYLMFADIDEVKCPRCKYDLRGSKDSDTCPECGFDIRETLAEHDNNEGQNINKTCQPNNHRQKKCEKCGCDLRLWPNAKVCPNCQTPIGQKRNEEDEDAFEGNKKSDEEIDNEDPYENE